MSIKIEKKVLSVRRFGPPLGTTLVVQLKYSDTQHSPTGWTARCVIHMGRQVQGLSGEEPAFAPPRIPPENSKAATDRSELAAGTLIQSLKRRQGAVRSGCRASVTCSTNADLAPARCLPSGSTKPLLPGEPAFPPDRHFRRTLRVIGVVTSCRYRCGRCGSWPPVLRFSPSPTLLPPSLSLPRRRSVVRRRLPDPSLTPF